MIGLLLTLALASHPPADSVVMNTLAAAPVLDGRLTAGEYGAAALTIPTAAGGVRIWLARHGGFVHLAAEIPDSTYYWGDDLVISLDPDGSAGDRPSPGDRQWYLRRTADSSVVSVVAGDHGRWTPPGQPQSALGAARGGADWDYATSSNGSGWTVELRIRETSFSTGAVPPRLAIRTFNDAPQGWWSWPAPPDGVPAHRVEITPRLWTEVLLR